MSSSVPLLYTVCTKPTLTSLPNTPPTETGGGVRPPFTIRASATGSLSSAFGGRMMCAMSVSLFTRKKLYSRASVAGSTSVHQLSGMQIAPCAGGGSASSSRMRYCSIGEGWRGLVRGGADA